MQAVIVPTSNMIAYIMRVEVELRHEGQAVQHNPHAALPQQQASWNQHPLLYLMALVFSIFILSYPEP